MGRNVYKLTKIFDNVIIIVILSRHHYFDVSRQLDFQGFLLNILKTVQLIFTKLMSFSRELCSTAYYIWNFTITS